MMRVAKVQPLSGFPELLPSQQIVFQEVLDVIRREYELHGFSPLETPAVERKEVLLSKGANDKEIYALSRLVVEEGETAETEMALHFDLTVPLARYVSAHKHELTFPFRRYQIQKVWRGERAQAGRYREFYQCDIDVIGRDSLDLLIDAEMPSVIYGIFRKLNIGRFVIRVNNKKLLLGILKGFGIKDEFTGVAARIIDKLEKIGLDSVIDELVSKVTISRAEAHALMQVLTWQGPTSQVFTFLREKCDKGGLLEEGISELSTVLDGVHLLGVPDSYLKIDLSIARGMNYYTGTVYETTLIDYPELGSVCSGGRYENLTSCFSEENLPGVGISIGVTRLVLKLLERGVLETGSSTLAPVLVANLDRSYLGKYFRMANLLREAGIGTEVFFGDKNLKKQLKYADKKGFALVLIAGEREFSDGVFQIKNMRSGVSETRTRDEVIPYVKKVIGLT